MALEICSRRVPYGDRQLWRSMRFREVAGVLRKLERYMGWDFGGTLEMTGGVSQTWSPTE